jgi:hypothetical protein
MLSYNKNAIRSSYSIYLDTEDKAMMALLGNPELTWGEERKTFRFDKPVQLPEKYALFQVEHAPYKVIRKDGTPRVVRKTYVVSTDAKSLEADASTAIARGFEQAKGYYRNEEYFDDYRKYVLFELEPEELEKMLLGARNLGE